MSAAPSPFKLTDYWIDPRQPAEHIDWGQQHLTAVAPATTGWTAAKNASSWMGSSNLARATFATSGALPSGGDDLAMPEPACGNVTSGYTACTCGIFPRMRGGNDYPTETSDDPIPGDLWPGLAIAFAFRDIGPVPTRATALLSYDDTGRSARYFGEVLPEVWRRDGTSFDQLLQNASDTAGAAIAAAEEYDRKLELEMMKAGGEDFAVLASAGYRGEAGWTSFVWFNGTLDGGKTTTPAGSGPIAFVKGLGSSGDTGTIDDNYRSIWSWVWGSPAALGAMVRPLNLFNDHQTFDPDAGYPRNVSFPYNYSVHYLGQYPVAELQCWNKARLSRLGLLLDHLSFLSLFGFGLGLASILALAICFNLVPDHRQLAAARPESSIPVPY